MKTLRLILFLGVIITLSASLPGMFTPSQAQQCEECGPPPPTPSDTTDTGGEGQNGSYRGHELIRLSIMAEFTLRNVYGKDPDDLLRIRRTPLEDWEINFLCSMKRLRVRNVASARIWFPAFLADLIGRPHRMVRDAMRSTDLCPPAPPRVTYWIG